MIKTSLLAALGVLALSTSPSSAHAGGQADSLGVGAEYMMNGFTGGASVNYDLGNIHFGGFLSFVDTGDDSDDTTDYSIGGRVYYHLHSTAMSDFGIGGGFGFYSDQVRAGGDTERFTYMFLEPGVQIRAFVTSNVALSFTLGIVLALQDAKGVAFTGGVIDNSNGIGGGVNAGAGIHYYFF
ncbi:MAG: hypothetical protein H0T89_03925 [Deltaproteobacteria bacterium]|nr:hypothetical protein [Deltaproteobacteria bacterium]MDQ3298043.1 hypothetical protein [Myxococcota bacterium]